LSDSIDNYDAFLVVVQLANNSSLGDGYDHQFKVLLNKELLDESSYTSISAYPCNMLGLYRTNNWRADRYIAINNGDKNSLTISSCLTGSSMGETNNTYLIPIEVYGISGLSALFN